MSRDDLSNTPEAIRARRFRKNRRAKRDQVKAIKDSGGAEQTPSVVTSAVSTEATPVATVPIHETRPSRAGGPDRFAAVPVIGNSSGGARGAEAGPVLPDQSTATHSSDGDVGAPGSPTPIVPQQPPPEPPRHITTPEEAAVFGKLLVGYFKFGTAMMFAKDPRAPMAFGAIVAGIPEIPGKPKLTPDQGFDALCGFIEGAAVRNALKYNFRIPYLDEGVCIAAIGVATYGLAMKPPDAKKIAAAKNANANGASQHEAAQQAARQAAQAQPAPQPPPQDDDGSMPIPQASGPPIDLSSDVA